MEGCNDPVQQMQCCYTTTHIPSQYTYPSSNVAQDCEAQAESQAAQSGYLLDTQVSTHVHRKVVGNHAMLSWTAIDG